jgi:hemolysin III
MSIAQREQTPGEEIANSAIHGVALLAAIAAVPLLLRAGNSSPVRIGSVGVFSATMVAVYLCSTLYHALPDGRGKCIAQKFDRASIYLFIAGSYTPFALGPLADDGGSALFCLVWWLAFLGVALTIFEGFSRPWHSTVLYLLMGWAVLLTAVPLVERESQSGFALLVGGGIAYTAGVAVYALDSRVRYAHAVWHVFVVTGTTCHYLAVLKLIAPTGYALFAS